MSAQLKQAGSGFQAKHFLVPVLVAFGWLAIFGTAMVGYTWRAPASVTSSASAAVRPGGEATAPHNVSVANARR